MASELFWLRDAHDTVERLLDRLPNETAVRPEARRWSDLDILQIGRASVLVEHSSGSWVAISPQCSSIEAFKNLIGDPAGMSSELAAFLFRRNILTDDQSNSYYPPTIETPMGRNLRIGYLFVVETTERCNLGCRYCFKSASPRGVAMSREMAFKVADYISLFHENAVTIDFSGGEPTLNRSAIEIIASVLRDRLPQARFNIQTNATLVDDDLIRLARRFKIIVGSSLEGSVSDLRLLRPFADGKDASKQILAGIHRLQHEGLFGGIVSTYNSTMGSDVTAFLNMLEVAGVSSAKLNVCAPLGRWSAHRQEDEGVLNRYAEYLKKLVGEGMLRTPPVKESITSLIAQRILQRIPSYRCTNSPCDAGYTFQNIRVNGDIFPCDRYSRIDELRLGNVASLEGGTARYLADASANGHDVSASLVRENPMVRTLNERTVRSITECSKCKLRSYCGSGCGMESYCRFGSFDRPSAQCEFYRDYIPWVFGLLTESSGFGDVYYPQRIEKFRFSVN